MKGGVRKNGQKNDELVEKAFAFVDWMVQLAHEGDAEREIPMLPKLQPSYALNTIVTSSQRAGSLPEAKRAFELLTCYGFEPDVFTYTALIDVTARSGDVQAAIEVKKTSGLSIPGASNLWDFEPLDFRISGFSNLWISELWMSGSLIAMCVQ
jgi:hypothetical protein